MTDSTALTTTGQDYGGLTMATSPAEAMKRLQQLQAFVQEVMKEGVDFGVIPGTDKPTLLQPGAQKLCEIYGFAISFVDGRTMEDWDKPLFHYEMKAVLTSRRDFSFVGDGIGSCNSKEKRYAGRWAFDNEIPAGIAKETLRRREGKSKKNGRPYTQFFMPNDDIFSLVNTMKKMACKRALVMAVIGATRSSGLFTQDVEDLPAEAFGKPAPDPEEPPPGPTEAEQKKAHHELRVMVTSAKKLTDLPIVMGLMRKAWTEKRLTKPTWDDLIAYGNKRREELGGGPLDGRAPTSTDDSNDAQEEVPNA